MIQFNLLPDVKLQYIKARKNKRFVIVVSVLVSAVAIGIMVLLFLSTVLQKQHLSNVSNDIKQDSEKLTGTPDLDKVLTIQNQLKSLSSLHDKKPEVTRLFGYLPQITPNEVSISELSVDFDQHTIAFRGNADALSTINKFVDTLKFTDYNVPLANERGEPLVDGNGQPQFESKKAFSSVVLASFSLNPEEPDPKKKAGYEVTIAFDPILFDITKTVSLSIPRNSDGTPFISTRSETEKPRELFINSPSSTEEQ